MSQNTSDNVIPSVNLDKLEEALELQAQVIAELSRQYEDLFRKYSTLVEQNRLLQEEIDGHG